MCDQGRMRSNSNLIDDEEVKARNRKYNKKLENIKEKLLKTVSECGGCHLHKSISKFSEYGLPIFSAQTFKNNCSMFNYLQTDKECLKFSANCACKECIVKSNCNILCDNFLNHYAKVKGIQSPQPSMKEVVE